MEQSIGDRIAILRKSLGKKQAEFAQELGLTGAAVSAMEKGKYNLTEGNIRLICFAYGANEEWLRNGAGEIMDMEARVSIENETLSLLMSMMSNRAKKMLFEYAEKLASDEEAVYGEGWWKHAAVQPADISAIIDRANSMFYRATALEPADFDMLSSALERKNHASKPAPHKKTSAHEEKRSGEMTQALFVGEPTPAYGERTIDVSRYAQEDTPRDKVRFTGWDMVILPHMGKVAAGRPIEIGGFTGEGIPFPRPKLRGSEEDYFTVEIVGNSMTEAGISDGDYVVIRKAVEPMQGKIMLVKHDGDSTLKRVKIKEARNGNRNGIEVYLHWEDGSGHFKLVDSSEYEIQGEWYCTLK